MIEFGDLRLQQLKMNIVTRSKPLQDESQEGEKQVVHTDSFRSARQARRAKKRMVLHGRQILVPSRKGCWMRDALYGVASDQERKSAPS